MKTFATFINELGEGTKPFPYKLHSKIEGDDVTHYDYRFKDGEHMDGYMVEISAHRSWHYDTKVDHRLSVLFGLDDPSSVNQFHATNLGAKQMFRVMTTVVDISLDVTKREEEKWGKVMSIGFGAEGKNPDEAAAKTKLYLAYIKKRVPVKSVKYLGSGETVVKLT